MTAIYKIPIDGVDNNEIKYLDKAYPKPKKTSSLPIPFYTCLLIGASGTGKTVAVVRLLKLAEKEKYYNENNEVVPQKIYIFSPTMEANQIYFTLKNLDPEDVIDNYTDSELIRVLEEVKVIKEEAEEYQEKLGIWKRFQKATSLLKFTPDEILILDIMNYEEPIKPKYPICPVFHFIMDDLLCQPGAFRPNGASPISSLSVKCRHYNVNLYILAQSSAQIPRVIRSQSRLLMLYRFNSKKVTTDLYETVSSLLTPEQFEEVYDFASTPKYGFLTVDNTGKSLILKQNLNFIISLKKMRKKNSKIKDDIEITESPNKEK